MIIDSHVHLTSPEIIASMDVWRKNEPYFDLLCGSPKNRNVDVHELIRDMDRTGVDRSVVFGFGFRDQDHCRHSNDYTIKAVEAYPDRLIGYAIINPAKEGVLTELERCRKAGLSGVGEIMPMGQEINITDSHTMEELCGFCGDAGWPLLVHVNELVGHYYPGKTGDSIREAETLAELFPETTFILAHMGGGLCFYESMPELREKLSRVYYDTAALPFLYDQTIFGGLKGLGVMEKVIYGSDYPLLDLERYLDRTNMEMLTESEKALFFGETISGILGINGGPGEAADG
jgi:uncharacterized protein